MSVTASTRLATPSHQPWASTPGQARAVEFMKRAYSGLLVADPGAGKTAIVLSAFVALKATAPAGLTMLVIAPLRVCQLVWRQECAKWSEFRHLKVTLLHGDKKEALLEETSDIFLINPEGVDWLTQLFFGRSLPFDILCIDELTKFKNPRAARCKKLRKRLGGVKVRWGLTGSLVPNGYMDLFGQMLMLDDGAALGRYITQYRDAYFTPGYDGFSYDLRHNAGKLIEERIQPYCFRLPYTELPPLVDDPRYVELSPAERKVYETMKRDMLVALGADTVTAANSGAVYSKLKQLANGAVYKDGSKEWIHVHDRKLEALQELIEELQGQPLLIGYEFRHDLQRLQAAFPNLTSFDGANEKQAIQIEADWNNNKLQLLAAHPASIGHGLNLQQGAASHIAWFSATIDYELYDQFIRRLRRRGNDAGRVVNHIFLTRGTVDDELTLPAIQDKGITQNGLLYRLAKAMGTSVAGDTAAQTELEHSMVMKLGKQTAGTLAQSEAAETSRPTAPTRITPSAWGKKVASAEPVAGNGAAGAHNPFGRRQAPAEEIEQKQEIERRITQTQEPEEAEETPVRDIARQAFSSEVQQELAPETTEPGQHVPDAPVKRTRRRASEIEVPVTQAEAIAADERAALREAHLRSMALTAVFEFIKAVGAPENGLSASEVVVVAEIFLTFLRG